MIGLRRIPVLPFALATAAGILVALYGDFASGLLLVIGAGFFVLAALSLWRFGGNLLSLLLVILFFALFGAWRATGHIARPERRIVAQIADSGETVALIGRVDVPAAPGMLHPSVILESVHLQAGQQDAAAGSLRFRLFADSTALKSARSGDYLFARGRLRSVSESYQLSEAAVITAVTQRIAGDVRADSNAVVIGAVGGYPVRRFVEKLRNYIIRTFNRELSPDGAALCKALVLGDRGDFSSDFSRQLRYTGLSHVFALSGMNVALLAGLVWYSLSLFYLPRTARLWIVLGVVLLYMELGREAPSLVRASLMSALFVLGHLLYRRAHVVNCVAGAAFLELLWRPLDLIDAGFLLSYLAVFGLVGAATYFYSAILTIFRRHNGFIRGAALIIASSVAAQISTLPMVAWLFHRVPLIGIIGNLVAIPAFAIMLIWSVLLLIVAPISSGAAEIVASSLDALSFGMGNLVNTLGSMPLASIQLPALHPILLAAILIAVGFLLVGLAQSRKYVILVSVLILANLVIWPSVFASGKPAVALTFFAVENGDATLISDRQGNQILLDAGPKFGDWSAAGRILPYFAANGIERLDGLILTHPDNDHIGGAADILNTLQVDQIFSNGDPGETRTYLETELSVEMRKRSIVRLSGGDILRLSPECTLRVLSPDSLQRSSNLTENQRSLVIKLDCGNTSALFPADVDSIVEAQLSPLGSLLRADLLKIGHHGSRASTSSEFLSMVSPTVAVISYGKHNRYGHPAKTVVDKLKAAGITIHRTASEGILRFETDGTRWVFIESRAQRLIRIWILPHA